MQNSPSTMTAGTQTAQAAAQAAHGHARTVDSTDLLRGDRSGEISHNGSVYRLQATKLGKLILTK